MVVAIVACPGCGRKVACKVPAVRLMQHRDTWPGIAWTVLNCARQQCGSDVPVYPRDFGGAEAA